MFKKTFLLALAASLLSLPASSAPLESLDTIHVKSGKVGMRSDSLELRSSGGTGVATFKFAGSSSNSPTITIPDSSSNANLVLTGGSLWQQSKRFVLTNSFNGGGTLSDSTTYKAFLVPGRAGTVTRVSVMAGTAPAGGTNTVKVLKGSSSGNTMLSAASYDPTNLTDNQASTMTLTSTAADLAVTASGADSGIYVEWAAGVQSTDAATVTISVEFEPDDL